MCPASYPGTSSAWLALRYFEQLGHDSQHRIFKFFAWEAAKAKAPNGGYVDYPKLASAKLKAMTTAEIGRFLVVCALASDLYFPSYLSSSTLPKDSNARKGSRALQDQRGQEFSGRYGRVREAIPETEEPLETANVCNTQAVSKWRQNPLRQALQACLFL